MSFDERIIRTHPHNRHSGFYCTGRRLQIRYGYKRLHEYSGREQLPADYDLLYLGCNLTSIPERYSQNLLKIATSYCTQAIGYNRKVVELILNNLNKIEPYDVKLMKLIQPRGQSFCTWPMFCEQFESYSDIEKKVVKWYEYQRITYNSYTKNI